METLIQRLRNLYVQNGTNYVQAAAYELEKQPAEIEAEQLYSSQAMKAVEEIAASSDAAMAEIKELRAKILAMACVQVDREESLEAECAKWKATAYENAGLVPADNVAKENQVLRAEIERITPVCNMFKNTSEHLGNDNKNLRKELTALKAQAVKDAADAGRLREALRLYVKAGYGNSTNLAQQGEAYDAAIEALKESQQ